MLLTDRILGLILLMLALVSLVEGFRIWDGMGGSGFMPVIVGSIFALLGLGFLTRKSHPGKKISLFPGQVKWACNDWAWFSRP